MKMRFTGRTRTFEHKYAQQLFAELFSELPDTERVGMAVKLSVFSGLKHIPDIQADVMRLRKTGIIDLLEVQSTWDTPRSLLRKLQRAMKQLPENVRGDIYIVDPDV